jgi:hypothetical protein
MESVCHPVFGRFQLFEWMIMIIMWAELTRAQFASDAREPENSHHEAGGEKGRQKNRQESREEGG